MSKPQLDEFTRAYIECALWSSTDNSNEQGGEPLDANYGLDDIAPETLAQIVEDCASFQAHQHMLLSAAYERYSHSPEWSHAEQAGHDFWLTRNHHGAGFWDRGLGDVGRKLTDAAHVYGSFDLYVGDDGKVYGS